MDFEEFLFLAVLAVMLLPLVFAARRTGSRLAVVGAGMLWLGALPAGLWSIRSQELQATKRAAAERRPIEVHADGYVSSTSCRACHPREYGTWHASYHRTMTQVASPEAVVGRFDGQRLKSYGETTEVMRRGEEFWARFPDLDAASSAPRPKIERPIVMTTGSHHMQVYWYPTGHGRTLGQLDWIYLIGDERWIPRNAAFLAPDVPPEFSETGRWNATCILCHTTRGHPRLAGPDNSPDPQPAEPDSHVREFGIACEACHGPAAEHVAQNQDPVSRYLQRFSAAPAADIVNPAALPHDRASQVCGRCHAVSISHDEESSRGELAHGIPFEPGDDLYEVRHVFGSEQPQTEHVEKHLAANPRFHRDRFWSDGMVRVSGREFSGMVRSPCYEQGELSCLSCHTMHPPTDDSRPLAEWANDQLKLGMDSNQACLQCHEEYSEPAQLERHSHHLASSAGSSCYNCHMPHTTYGLLKAIRSHQIDSPSVAATVETGRPNACNACHLDQTLAWSADYLNRWYGIPIPELSQDQKTIAASLLWALRGDAGQRALASWYFGWQPAQEASGTDWMAPALAQLLDDPYPAVRYIAYRSLRSLPLYEKFPYDFLAERDQRLEGTVQAWKIWNHPLLKGQRRKGQEVLIDPQGGLNHDVFQRLVGERNDEIVILNE